MPFLLSVLLFFAAAAPFDTVIRNGRVIDGNDSWAKMFGHTSAADCRGTEIQDCYRDPSKREALLAATEIKLAKIKVRVTAGKLSGKDAISAFVEGCRATNVPASWFDRIEVVGKDTCVVPRSAKDLVGSQYVVADGVIRLKRWQKKKDGPFRFGTRQRARSSLVRLTGPGAS
jgi:hypothetical protein